MTVPSADNIWCWSAQTYGMFQSQHTEADVGLPLYPARGNQGRLREW